MPAAPASAGTRPGVPRQLLGGEIEALWELADNAERQLIGLLLIGVSSAEARRLDAAAFDLAAAQVQIAPTAPARTGRTLTLPPRLQAELATADPLPAWASDPDGSEALFTDLCHRLPLLASDAGIAHADEVDANSLRDSYLIYLVRQGARLTQLEQIAGPMGSAALQRYAAYAPAGAALPLAQVTLTYPVLA